MRLVREACAHRELDVREKTRLVAASLSCAARRPTHRAAWPGRGMRRIRSRRRGGARLPPWPRPVEARLRLPRCAHAGGWRLRTPSCLDCFRAWHEPALPMPRRASTSPASATQAPALPARDRLARVRPRSRQQRARARDLDRGVKVVLFRRERAEKRQRVEPTCGRSVVDASASRSDESPPSVTRSASVKYQASDARRAAIASCRVNRSRM